MLVTLIIGRHFEEEKEGREDVNEQFEGQLVPQSLKESKETNIDTECTSVLGAGHDMCHLRCGQ